MIKKHDNVKAFLYLLPALVIILCFQIIPIVKAFMMGFYTKFDYLTGAVDEVGLDNFIYVWNDPEFRLAIKNTTIYALVSAPLGILLALILAIIINENTRFKRFFQSVYFLPFVTSTTAITVVFRWIFNKDYGVMNAFLSVFGMPKVAWLTDAHMTIPILILMSVWKGLGYKIIILLAGLQNVDKRYDMAGKMDGASKIKRIRYITVPIIRPVVLFLSIVSMIGAFKLFDEVNVLYANKPGPMQSGLTMVYYIFEKFYRHWEFATASAAAFLLFVIILVLTGLQYLVWGKQDKDEN